MAGFYRYNLAGDNEVGRRFDELARAVVSRYAQVFESLGRAKYAGALGEVDAREVGGQVLQQLAGGVAVDGRLEEVAVDGFVGGYLREVSQLDWLGSR